MTRPSRSLLLDLLLAAAFLAAMLTERLSAAPELGDRLPLAVLLSTVQAAAVAARRSTPLSAYLAATAALSAESLWVLSSPVAPYANIVGLHALGLHGTRARAWAGPFIALAGMAGYFTGSEGARAYPAIPAGVLFLWLLGWAIGYGTARRLEEREAARARLHRDAVSGERARMARELHDLVGHTVNVMLVQAGAARRLLEREPERTRTVLTELEQTGRDALDELDRVLAALRHEPEREPEREPDDPSGRPGLADLGRLTGRMDRAGLTVGLRLEPGAAARLPRSIDVSAYRIVQEALTNTVKHGRAASADVSVRRLGDRLEIEVSDDGRGPAEGYVPGRGLIGISERVSMLGGSVEHGGGDRGGFRLHAVLPVR
ncbi:sensor histidine kinase [Kitasatospora sp. NPDC051853]|uniref:sensor histidine kinase n=1 Tax=Kitasatospora sp. NPDC051853 TaxID=3364058 RepID=UPI0037B1D902